MSEAHADGCPDARLPDSQGGSHPGREVGVSLRGPRASTAPGQGHHPPEGAARRSTATGQHRQATHGSLPCWWNGRRLYPPVVLK